MPCLYNENLSQKLMDMIMEDLPLRLNVLHNLDGHTPVMYATTL